MFKKIVFIVTFLISIVANAQQKTEPLTRQSASDDSVKQEWIDRYLSVAYPLSKIVVTSQYGYRRDPFTGKRTLHNGMDFGAPTGETVYAMMFGQITKVGYDARSGNFLTIRHGDFTVSYCHLSRILVKPNQYVAAGDPVAHVGSTGRSTGPHLHLVLRHRGSYVNPMVIINFIRQTRTEALDALTGISTNADVIY